METTNKDYIDVVHDYLEENNIKAIKDEDGVAVRFSIPHVPELMMFTFEPDAKRAHLDAVGYLEVEELGYEDLYPKLNHCNSIYPYIKFVLDADHNQVRMMADVDVKLKNAGKKCLNLLLRFYTVAQNAYSLLTGEVSDEGN